MKSLRNGHKSRENFGVDVITILYFTQYSNVLGEIGFSKGGNITIPGKVTTVSLCVCFV